MPRGEEEKLSLNKLHTNTAVSIPHLNRLRLRLCANLVRKIWRQRQQKSKTKIHNVYLIFSDFCWRCRQIFLTRFATMKPSSGLWLLKHYHLWEKLGHQNTARPHLYIFFWHLEGFEAIHLHLSLWRQDFFVWAKRLKRRTLMPNNISWAVYFPAEFTGVNHRRYWDHGPVDQGLAASP